MRIKFVEASSKKKERGGKVEKNLQMNEPILEKKMRAAMTRQTFSDENVCRVVATYIFSSESSCETKTTKKRVTNVSSFAATSLERCFCYT